MWNIFASLDKLYENKNPRSSKDFAWFLGWLVLHIL